MHLYTTVRSPVTTHYIYSAAVAAWGGLGGVEGIPQRLDCGRPCLPTTGAAAMLTAGARLVPLTEPAAWGVHSTAAVHTGGPRCCQGRPTFVALTYHQHENVSSAKRCTSAAGRERNGVSSRIGLDGSMGTLARALQKSWHTYHRIL